MGKSKRRGLLFPLALLLGIAVCWSWLSRPMTLEEMFPGFSWTQVVSIDGACNGIRREYAPDGRANAIPFSGQGTFAPAEVSGLLEATAQARFSRSLPGTVADRFSWGQRSVPLRGDGKGYSMSLLLQTGDAPLELWLVEDELTISYRQTSFRCSTRGQRELLDSWFALLLEQPGEGGP